MKNQSWKVLDHRMEKAWWPEMYMGWPVDSLYDKVSNIIEIYLGNHYVIKLNFSFGEYKF